MSPALSLLPRRPPQAYRPTWLHCKTPDCSDSTWKWFWIDLAKEAASFPRKQLQLQPRPTRQGQIQHWCRRPPARQLPKQCPQLRPVPKCERKEKMRRGADLSAYLIFSKYDPDMFSHFLGHFHKLYIARWQRQSRFITFLKIINFRMTSSIPDRCEHCLFMCPHRKYSHIGRGFSTQ